MHAAMLLILVLAIAFAQILIIFWKRKHFKSYQTTTTFLFWLAPMLIACYNHWFRSVDLNCFSVALGLRTRPLCRSLNRPLCRPQTNPLSPPPEKQIRLDLARDKPSNLCAHLQAIDPAKCVRFHTASHLQMVLLSVLALIDHHRGWIYNCDLYILR